MPEQRRDREQQQRIENEKPRRDENVTPARRTTRGDVTGWSPFDSTTSPFELMRRMWGGMFAPLTPFSRDFGGLGLWNEAVWSPQVEIFERDNKLVVRADLPGLNKDDIRVELQDNVLTIEGERRQEREEEKEGYHRSERSYGSFYRSIPLPEGTTGQNVKASFRDGVLEVTMDAPKRPERKGRRIEISESRADR